MSDHVNDLETEAFEALSGVRSTRELEEWRVRFLGRKGTLAQVLRGLGGLSPDERREAGARANRLKASMEAALEKKEASLREQASSAVADRDRIDVTLPGRAVQLGRLHPITQTIREITRAFSAMGFQVVEGPEVELDYYNFEALNIPHDHPARDLFDTMWIDRVDERGQRPMLLRTHTSPMQIRYMETHRPPIRVVVPGRVFRHEATDATHEWHFHQVEGLAVGRGVTFADLKGTLHQFARRIFGVDRKVRFRCDYFPFVEPGAEMAVSSDNGWLEIMGAGMVHPKVLERVGYDPEEYTGYAFGMGVDRIAMLKYGIDDVRLFYANDLRFLRQF